MGAREALLTGDAERELVNETGNQRCVGVAYQRCLISSGLFCPHNAQGMFYGIAQIVLDVDQCVHTIICTQTAHRQLNARLLSSSVVAKYETANMRLSRIKLHMKLL